jgi:hypothetical protein
MRDAGDFWKASLVGGVAASFAMDVAQDVLALLFERGRAPDDLDEEVEGIAGVLRALAALAPAWFPAHAARVEARILHYAFGIAFAAAYVAGTRRAPWLGASGGTAFGAGLFLLSDRFLIPALKLGRSWQRYSRSERANAFLSHVVYGVVLEAMRKRFAA